MSLKKFLEHVPEAHRDMGIFKEADNIDVVFERIGELNAHRGQSIRIPTENASAEDMAAFDAKLTEKVPGLVRMPGEDADDAARNSFYGQLGRPNEAAGYQLPETPEGMEPNPEAFEALGAFAFENGLTQKQFNTLATREIERQHAADTELAAKSAETVSKLKESWGSAFDSRKALVKEFLDKTFPHNKELPLESLDADSIFSFEKLAVAAASEGGLGGDFSNTGSGDDGTTTRAEARNRINEIMGNPNHPYHTPGAAGYDEAQVSMRKLYQISAGAKP